MDPKLLEPALAIHLACAVGALVLGGAVVFRRKGDRVHRLTGRLFVVLLAAVAVSAFWINDIRMWGPFSPLHLLSFLTLGSLAMAIGVFRFVVDRERAVTIHRQIMLRLYGGALLIPGAFTLLPHRLLGRTLVPGAETWPNYAAMAVLITGGALVLLHASRPLVRREAATVPAPAR